MQREVDVALMRQFLMSCRRFWDIERGDYKAPFKKQANALSEDFYLDWMNPHGSRIRSFPEVMMAMERLIGEKSGEKTVATVSKKKVGNGTGGGEASRKDIAELRSLIQESTQATNRVFAQKADELTQTLRELASGSTGNIKQTPRKIKGAILEELPNMNTASTTTTLAVVRKH